MSRHITLVLADFPPMDMAYGGTFSHGAAALAASLKQAGHKIRLLHLTGPCTRTRFLAQLCEADSDLIGFSAITPVFPEVKRWIAWAREVSAAPIVVGGTHAILDPEGVMATPGVDLVCTGEGEETLVEICDRLERRRGLSGISGTWRQTPSGAERNSQRALIEDLDALPLPDYSVFDSARLYGAAAGWMMVMVSRGCAYRCAYCANDCIRSTYPNPWAYARHFSPVRAVDIVESLREAHPRTRELSFHDNILYPSRPWLEEFSSLYRRRVGLPFTANTRPNLVDEPTVRLLREAGCIRIAMGVECGDERIANEVLKRGLLNDQIRRAFALFHAGGIETSAYNILGSPFEDRSTMLRTVRLNAEIEPTTTTAFLFYPYRGTEAEAICRKNGFLTKRWGRHNSDCVMIRQPTLSEVDVLFTQRYFGRLVRSYGQAKRLPRALRGPAERFLDGLTLSPFVPRRVLLLAQAAKRRGRRLTASLAVPRPAPPPR